MLTFIFADSLHFTTSKDAGVLATAVLGDGNVSDVECTHPQLLVHYISGSPTEWRCPSGIMFLPDSSVPFVPWPDYSHGNSGQLTHVLDALMDSAGHAEYDERQ